MSPNSSPFSLDDLIAQRLVQLDQGRSQSVDPMDASDEAAGQVESKRSAKTSQTPTRPLPRFSLDSSPQQPTARPASQLLKTRHRIPVLELDSRELDHLGQPQAGRAALLGDSLERIGDISQTAAHTVATDHGEIWLSGTSLLCRCPDCQAPMTIRLWLRLADCWRCQSSISLTESQMRTARELTKKLAAPARQLPSAPAVTRTAPENRVAAPKIKREFVPPGRTNLPTTAPRLKPFVPPTAGAQTSRQREYEELSRGSWAASLFRSGFRLTPAWLVSLILHVIALLILALVIMGDKNYLPDSITLSSFLSEADETGGEIRTADNRDLLQDDLLSGSKLAASDREIRNTIVEANKDAKTLQVDPTPVTPLPNINIIKKNITTRPEQSMSFAARDPRVRSEIVRKEGGTTITEAAVARGIRWLASVQNQNGGWNLRRYNRSSDPDNPSDVMGTSLALLPMLGAGQTHEYGVYKKNVEAGLAWLIKNQADNGDLRAGYTGQAGMYAHGQATIVLCEALALTGDERFREPAQRAIKFIELAQHGKGGWRYQPGQAGDTSVFGWHMMALQSARADGMDIDIDDSTLKLADYFLDQVTAKASFKNRRRSSLPDGAAYCYQPGREATAAMTAEAILCRMYLGWKRDDPRIDAAVKWLITDHLPSSNEKNLYYWYYGTQVMHNYGGEQWNTWNDRMRALLISSQDTRSRNAGSWEHTQFEWGPKGGRIYTTSLAVCTLEVYYRHLPLFKQIELD